MCLLGLLILPLLTTWLGNITIWLIFRHISLCYIGLPNGAQSIATVEVIVKFRSKFILTGVLYIPNFTCNLLPISQLLHYYPTNDVMFSKDFWVMQDFTTKMEIGASKVFHGVYHFAQPQANHAYLISWNYYINVWATLCLLL